MRRNGTWRFWASPADCFCPPFPRQDLEYVVRQHLGEQLDDIARFCRAAGKEAGYRLIIEVRNLPPSALLWMLFFYPRVRSALEPAYRSIYIRSVYDAAQLRPKQCTRYDS